MNNKQLIELLKTLSGVQAWALSLDESMPDYLHDNLLKMLNETSDEIEKRISDRVTRKMNDCLQSEKTFSFGDGIDIEKVRINTGRFKSGDIFDTSKLMPKPDLTAPLEHPWLDVSPDFLNYNVVDIRTTCGREITFASTNTTNFEIKVTKTDIEFSITEISVRYCGLLVKQWRPSVKKSL